MSLPKVVAFGGGHGLAATLMALKRLTDCVTAVVTVADDGGSSGRLREEFDCLPPGDLRMALAALTGDNPEGRLWTDVLQSRFGGSGPLSGHAIGNLLIAGLWQRDPNPVTGLDAVGRLLEAQGRVLPMASVPLVISADVVGIDHECPDDVCCLTGQARIAETEGDVLQVRLTPPDPPACPEAVASIMEADYLIFGPGSWFTSVVPHLLVPELVSAILTTKAKRICVMNLSPVGETSGFTPTRHIEVLAEHCPQLTFDTVIADPRFVQDDPHLEQLVASMRAELLVAEVGLRDGSPRHDPFLLAATLADVMEL
ncbi:MAG: uridine diphosphate-N-acetylglucosamine-binding protein YvcK [Propionibacteriaceae bacterium]|nr:uridine diphosphate-N-acetylglucosamine-binding protein YvcK [Propionibacteriaceae bacterium]